MKCMGALLGRPPGRGGIRETVQGEGESHHSSIDVAAAG